MKVQECPYTKKLLEVLAITNDVNVKAPLIASIKSLICNNPNDRTVCCEVDNGEHQIQFFDFNYHYSPKLEM